MIDVCRTENDVEVAAGEGTDSSLGGKDVAGFGRDVRMDLRRLFAARRRGCARARTEQLVTGADLRETRAEPDRSNRDQ